MMKTNNNTTTKATAAACCHDCTKCGGACAHAGELVKMNAKQKAAIRINWNGNTKTGGTVATFSKLAGADVYAITLSNGETVNVRGTCSGVCDCCGVWIVDEDGTKHRPPCYVFKSYRYPSVIQSHGVNTLNMRNATAAAFEDIRGQLSRKRKAPQAFRIHQSGELETVEELNGWNETAAAFPFIPFFVYTKRLDIVGPWLLAQEKAGTLSPNFIILVSVWHEYGLGWFNTLKHLQNVKAFAYMDPEKPNGWGAEDYERHGLKIETTCKAYQPNEKGKMTLNHEITCARCRKCFNNVSQVIGCLDH